MSFSTPHRGRLALLGVQLALLAGCATFSKPVQPPPKLALAAPAIHVPRVEPIDVEHYALELVLDPEQRALHGTCSVRFLALEPLDEVGLDLVELDVEAVEDADGYALEFAHAGGRLTIQLAPPLAAGERGTVQITYGGSPRKGLWFVAERDGVPTQVFTQGECEDARWWFPCVDEPSERATSEIVVEVPRGWRVVAAGELVERIDLDEEGRARERWRMSTPHPAYLTTLVAGELAASEASWDGVPLLQLGPPDLAPSLEPTFAATGEILAFLSRLTGVRYPYPKYAQACVDNFPFGGMENVSATTLTDTALRDERGRRDRPPDGLIAHEAAHQWFGDLLTCASWPEIWLNEGFATYAAALWFEEKDGADAFRARMRAIQDAYVEKDRRPPRWTMLHDRYRDPMDLFFTGLPYQGGAARLHLLRRVVGEQSFRRGLRAYVARNAGRAVTTADLRAAMEQASGLELARFFEQWFHSPGFPELDVRWRYDEGRGRLSLAVRQVQEISDGTPEVFEVPLDVEIRDSRGRRRVSLELTRRQEIFDLPAAERPLWVRFDKGGWIPKLLSTTKDFEEWLLIAREDDDANGRLDAVRALGRLAREAPNVAARERLVATLVECLIEDRVPQVRVRAAEALSGVREAAGIDALRRAAAGDSEASVRVAALDALAECGADPERARFAAEIRAEGFSWGTMAAAAASECAASGGGEAALGRLLELLDTAESPHGMLQAALIEQLARRASWRDSPAALRNLAAFAADPARPGEARAAALLALKDPARRSAELRQLILACLDERDVRVRRAAIEAVGEVHDAETARVLIAEHARTVDVRERRAIEAALGDTTAQRDLGR